MKKKQIAQLGVTLGLVAAVGVGGTLAILSQTTGPVVNTFAVGDGITQNDVTIDETNVEADGWDGEMSETERDMANNYEIMPGVSLVKDPQVHITANAADCYVFVNVHNADAFADELGNTNVIFDDFGANGQWVKLYPDSEGYDGIYYYKGSAGESTGTKVSVGNVAFNSPKVFTGITLNKDADVYRPDGTAKTDLPKIQVKAAAVQATELSSSWNDAVTLVEDLNWGTWQ